MPSLGNCGLSYVFLYTNNSQKVEVARDDSSPNCICIHSYLIIYLLSMNSSQLSDEILIVHVLVVIHRGLKQDVT